MRGQSDDFFVCPNRKYRKRTKTRPMQGHSNAPTILLPFSPPHRSCQPAPTGTMSTVSLLFVTLMLATWTLLSSYVLPRHPTGHSNDQRTATRRYMAGFGKPPAADDATKGKKEGFWPRRRPVHPLRRRVGSSGRGRRHDPKDRRPLLVRVRPQLRRVLRPPAHRRHFLGHAHQRVRGARRGRRGVGAVLCGGGAAGPLHRVQGASLAISMYAPI